MFSVIIMEDLRRVLKKAISVVETAAVLDEKEERSLYPNYCISRNALWFNKPSESIIEYFF